MFLLPAFVNYICKHLDLFIRFSFHVSDVSAHIAEILIYFADFIFYVSDFPLHSCAEWTQQAKVTGKEDASVDKMPP